MDQWYYAKGGQQNGPVTTAQMLELVGNGSIAGSDLVWNSSMKDWAPASQVPEISGRSAVVAPAAAISNPYAAPQSEWVEPSVSGGAVAEIVPGSDPLEPTACIKRGWEILKRNLGTVVVVGLVYIGISIGLNFLQQMLVMSFGAASPGTAQSPEDLQAMAGTFSGIALVLSLISMVVSIYLGLGLTRVGLNLVSGKEASVGMLFGEGGKVLPAIGASILFSIMVGFGLLLLIVPGIYLALRYGQYMTAIVDRNLGVFDSFSYSSSLTTNNKMPILVLWLLAFVLLIAGLIALCIGYFVAIPIVWLAFVVAYRWMQYGRAAVMDHPGTQTPVISGQ